MAFPVQHRDFYETPAVMQLADAPRWTVSDVDKMPLDMRALQRGELRQDGGFKGALERNANYLMTLPELCAFLPDAANHAFALIAPMDGVCVLDIERNCPEEDARRLLRLPALYVERSMSGLGYHLLMPLPANFAQLPQAMTRTALVHPSKHYEVLLDHWVTFTRNTVPAHQLPEPDLSPGAWERVFAKLVETAPAQTTAPAAAIDEQRPAIPGREIALEWLARKPLPKVLSDFGGDHSRYEFSSLATLYSRLQPMLVALSDNFSHEYSDTEKAWLLYDALISQIPHRDKHDERRNGLPLLLHAAASLLADRARA